VEVRSKGDVLNRGSVRPAMFLMNEPQSAGLFRASPLAALDYLGVLRGEVVPNGVIPFRWMSGSTSVGDVVYTDAVFPVLLSGRARIALSGIRGWTSYPVSLTDSHGHPIRNFHLLTVQGRCGRIDFEKSSAVRHEYPGGVFQEYRGVFFDDDSWDHSDVFMPKNRIGYIFASERAKVAIESLGSPSPHFERLDQVQLDEMTRKQIERT
jgi:hypothetical protein